MVKYFNIEREVSSRRRHSIQSPPPTLIDRLDINFEILNGKSAQLLSLLNGISILYEKVICIIELFN